MTNQKSVREFFNAVIWNPHPGHHTTHRAKPLGWKPSLKNPLTQALTRVRKDADSRF